MGQWKKTRTFKLHYEQATRDSRGYIVQIADGPNGALPAASYDDLGEILDVVGFPLAKDGSGTFPDLQEGDELQITIEVVSRVFTERRSMREEAVKPPTPFDGSQ